MSSSVSAVCLLDVLVCIKQLRHKYFLRFTWPSKILESRWHVKCASKKQSSSSEYLAFQKCRCESCFSWTQSWKVFSSIHTGCIYPRAERWNQFICCILKCLLLLSLAPVNVFYFIFFSLLSFSGSSEAKVLKLENLQSLIFSFWNKTLWLFLFFASSVIVWKSALHFQTLKTLAIGKTMTQKSEL